MHNSKKITEKLLETQRLISEEIQESKDGSKEQKLLRKARLGVRVALLCFQHAEEIHDFGTLDE